MEDAPHFVGVRRSVLIDDVVNKTKGFWTNPVTLGVMLGLLLIGPDHLGTLMALSTLTSGFASFKVGFAWGIGHSLGMILICPIFFSLRRLSSRHFAISVESWEYYGDYFIGASLVLVAAYFVVYESKYLEKQEDGTLKIKGCVCCIVGKHKAGTCPVVKVGGKKRFCASYGAQGASKSNCMDLGKN